MYTRPAIIDRDAARKIDSDACLVRDFEVVKVREAPFRIATEAVGEKTVIEGISNKTPARAASAPAPPAETDRAPSTTDPLLSP